jgi:hypothetical protein
MATIIFNGKTYNSIEEMPPEARQAYEQVANMLVDKNGNGIPDFLEGDLVKNIMSAVTSTNFNFNGQTYNHMNDLPLDAQQKVQDAFKKLSEMGIVSGDQHFAQIDHSHLQGTSMPVSKPFVSREYNPAIQEESGTGPMLWIGLGVALVLCVALAAAVFLFGIQ